ncbi:MAG: hypothetical protein ACRDKY_00585 [Solirubrobacteraceae bacterium]
MIALTRRGSMLAGIALIAALAALATTIGTQNAWSASYKSCSLSESEQNPSNDKPTYVLSVKRKNTSCSTAKKVAKSYHSCRSKLGTSCNRKVRTHWTCTARKTSSSSLSFYATATCKWGTRRVRTQYQQNK